MARNKKSILLRNGNIIDPFKKYVYCGDVRTSFDKIEEISEKIRVHSYDDVIDISGKLVMPGLVDIHVHISRCSDGHCMLARAGVTTALDAGGIPNDMIKGFYERGCGLSIGFLYPLLPDNTVSSEAPSYQELEKTIDGALANGAMGVKILGGHYPLTKTTSRNVIKISNERSSWVAIHAGSSETPGDIRGMEELPELAENRPLHIAHINSYCRGIQDSPLNEAKRALDTILKMPNSRSESYLALINGTSGKLENGEPGSRVTRRSLIQGGYTADYVGLEKAIKEGWARVHFHDITKREIVLLPPEDGLKLFKENDTNVPLSFAVNSPCAAIPIALAKNTKGEFIVNALATDGGIHPRNVTLKQGLYLVKFGAMTLNELAYKACLAPARLMGLKDRGFLSPGARADITVVNPDTFDVEMVIAGGRIIYRNGETLGKGGDFICSPAGKEFFRRKSILHTVTEPEWLNVKA